MVVHGMLVSLSCLFVFKVIPLFCTVHFYCTSFFSNFEKMQCRSNVSGLSVCIFVAVCVQYRPRAFQHLHVRKLRAIWRISTKNLCKKTRV